MHFYGFVLQNVHIFFKNKLQIFKLGIKKLLNVKPEFIETKKAFIVYTLLIQL